MIDRQNFYCIAQYQLNIFEETVMVEPEDKLYSEEEKS